MHRSEIMTEIFDARAVVVGSPTLNNQLFPSLADFLVYMKGLKPLNKIGAAFGSYGWSGEAPKYLLEIIKNKFEMQVVEPPLLAKYVPDENMLGKCRDLGKRVSEILMHQT